MKSLAFIAPNQVRAYLIGAYQKAHDLHKNCPEGLRPALVLAGWMRFEWGIPAEICEAEAEQILQEAQAFAGFADHRKARDERVNELVFRSLQTGLQTALVTPEWVARQLEGHPGTKSEITALLGFTPGDLSNYLSGKKPIPNSRKIQMLLFFT